MTDIFEFWREVAPNAHVHPADGEVFARVRNHGFDLSALPGCFMGPLRTAPVVLLFLSPGSSDMDRPTRALRQWHRRTRSGSEPLVSRAIHASAYRWWTQRTMCFECEPDELAGKVAVLNIGAYHSKTFNDHGLLAALPSSRVTLEWTQRILFPAAEAGNRIVICMRAARYWGLEAGRRYEGTLFAPNVTRGGHMHTAGRRRIIDAVKRCLRR